MRNEEKMSNPNDSVKRDPDREEYSGGGTVARNDRSGDGTGPPRAGRRPVAPEPPIDTVLSRLERVKKSRDGYAARCPAHNDRNPSLCVSEGDDGQVLLHCNAGCEPEDVVAAIGMQMRDLFPDNGSNGAPKAEPVYHVYHDEDGEPLFRVVRKPGKKFFQQRWTGNAWEWGLKDTRRVPYRLPEVIAAVERGETIHVVEGEKDVHAVERAGGIATTNPGGAGGWRKGFAKYFRDADTVIVADLDDAGLEHARDVAESLEGIAGSVRIVRSAIGKPGSKADASDHLGVGRGLDEFVPLDDGPGEGDTERVSPSPPLRWKPFPTDALPTPLAEYVYNVAAAIGVDEAFVALPVLVTLAGTIGNRRRVKIKNGFEQPAILWGGIVGRSGSTKSPVLKEVTRPVEKIEIELIKRHKAAEAEHERALDAWKDKAKAERGSKPEPPPPVERSLTKSTTVEGLKDRLADSPAGVLCHRDELAGWIKSMNQYKKGGDDLETYLSMYDAASVINDRKTDDETTAIDKAAVSILGGIQTEILRKALVGENIDNGFAARFLFAMPPERKSVWSEDEIDDRTRDRWAGLIKSLRTEYDPSKGPHDLSMTPEAKREWIEFHDEIEERRFCAENGALRAAYSKLKGGAARLALVLQLAHDPTAKEVGFQAMRAGTRLAFWFAHEARRVYARFHETGEERERRELVEWIGGRGGSVTVRDVVRGPRRFRGEGGTDDARAALDDLVSAGWGTWRKREPGPEGGWTVDVFHLDDTGDGDTRSPGDGRNAGDTRSGDPRQARDTTGDTCGDTRPHADTKCRRRPRHQAENDEAGA